LLAQPPWGWKAKGKAEIVKAEIQMVFPIVRDGADTFTFAKRPGLGTR
jgi:hypothetical protein